MRIFCIAASAAGEPNNISADRTQSTGTLEASDEWIQPIESLTARGNVLETELVVVEDGMMWV